MYGVKRVEWLDGRISAIEFHPDTGGTDVAKALFELHLIPDSAMAFEIANRYRIDLSVYSSYEKAIAMQQASEGVDHAVAH